MCALSKVYKEYNGTDMFDDFLDSISKGILTKYYKVVIPNGKKIWVDETGKKVKYIRDNCKYLNVFLSYIEELDEYILTYFIKPCLNDLIKISELIIKDEVDGLNLNLEKLYK